MTEPSSIVKIAHNLGLATWFGGTLFGQVALNPSVRRISDRSERGQVLNEAWGRYNVANLAAIAITLLTWRAGGLKADGELRAPVLARAKDFLLGGAALNAFGSAVLGATIASQGPEGLTGGGTPVERGMEPASETPEEAAWAQRLVGLTGASSLALLVGVIAASTAIETSAVKPRGLLSRLLT